VNDLEDILRLKKVKKRQSQSDVAIIKKMQAQLAAQPTSTVKVVFHISSQNW
jgi:hypothetical protein